MQADRIDLNQADVTTLATLPGIGRALASRIIQYRETVHPFEEVIELAAVPGISERMVRALADRVTVNLSESDRAVTAPPLTLTEHEVEEVNNQMATREDDIETAPLKRDPAAPEAETRTETVPPMPDTTTAPPPVTARRPEPEPTPASPPVATQAQRRGCTFIVLGAILGAFVGTIFTLAVLATLNNGTLSFNQRDNQLSRELEQARQAQSDLASQLDSLNTQLEALNGAVSTAATQQTQTEQMLSDTQEELTAAQVNISALEEATDALDDRLTTVAVAAENFDTFLNSLRDLLLDLQGPPPSPTATRTPTSTPAATGTATSQATPTAVATETVATTGTVDATGTAPTTQTPVVTATPPPATRTPHPTATPLIQPTQTPAQQP